MKINSSFHFVVCGWLPGDGDELVSGQDINLFKKINPFGKVFKCVSAEDNWLMVSYGADIFRADERIFAKVPSPKFFIGDLVVTDKNLTAVVVDVVWHHKDGAPMYFLKIEEKKSSRRYFDRDLRSANEKREEDRDTHK